MSREMNKEEASPKIKDYNNLPKPVAINVERAFISALMIDRDAHKKTVLSSQKCSIMIITE